MICPDCLWVGGHHPNCPSYEPQSEAIAYNGQVNRSDIVEQSVELQDLKRRNKKLRRINSYLLEVLKDNGITVFEGDATFHRISYGALCFAAGFGAGVSLLAILGVI